MKRSLFLILVVVGAVSALLLLFGKEGSKTLFANSEDPRTSVSEAQQLEPKRETLGIVSNEVNPNKPASPGPPTFRNGSLEIALAFDDGTLDEADALRIADDLSNVFSHLAADLVRIDDRNQLVFEGKGRSWPDALDTAWLIREVSGKRYLRVPKSVSDAYMQAFDFIEQHEIRESDVAELLAGVGSGSANAESIVLLSTRSVAEEDILEALENMSTGQIKPPSALAYRFPEESAGLDSLIAETLFLQFDEDVVAYSQRVVVIRVDDKWKIAL
jgi:hypothetical protein